MSDEGFDGSGNAVFRDSDWTELNRLKSDDTGHYPVMRNINDVCINCGKEAAYHISMLIIGKNDVPFSVKKMMIALCQDHFDFVSTVLIFTGAEAKDTSIGLQSKWSDHG